MTRPKTHCDGCGKEKPVGEWWVAEMHHFIDEDGRQTRPPEETLMCDDCWEKVSPQAE